MSDPTLAAAPPPPVSPLPPPPSATPPILPPPTPELSSTTAAAAAGAAAASNPPASLKPLLNPLQTTDPPPASTLVEPPRSPNPANSATDELGRNVELGPSLSGPGSAVGPGDLPFGSGSGSGPNGIAEPAPAPAVDAQQQDQPPLPIDAPVPPSPAPPHDEIPPTLPPGLIPPAVSTPTVITTEDDAMAGLAPEEPLAPAPTPAVGVQAASQPPNANAAVSPLPPIASPMAPSPILAQPMVAQEPAVPAADGMDVDADGDADADAVGEEDEPSSRAVDRSLAVEASPSTLKRPGEELAGPDEKRAREGEGQSSQLSAPVVPTAPSLSPAPFAAAPAPSASPLPPLSSGPSTSTAAPSVPHPATAAPPTTFVPTVYTPPPPRDAGPTTPLTQNQHKHLLNAVRTLKKSKDAVNFLAPVDVVLFGIPHYVNIVKSPMDLGTVETKLVVSNPRGPPKDKSKMGNWDTSKGSYRNVSEVVQDVRQIWENTRMFNGQDHVVSQMATRLEATFEKALAALPAEPIATPQASPAPFVAPAPPAAAAAGPSTASARRASISRPPAPRRSSDGLDRPKREIHPPPSKELPYANDQSRKKRRNDPQINYLAKQIRMFESKNADLTGPFLYPVEDLIAIIPEYTTVVKNPIDLNHIKGRITEGEYDDADQLNGDFRLMCNNATKFNPPTHEVHVAAQKFLKLWDEKWKAMPPKEVPVVRPYSESPTVEEVAEVEEDDFENDPTIKVIREQIAQMEAKIEQLKAERRKAQPSRPGPKKSKPSGSAAAAARKQSMSQQAKTSPGLNGNGHGHASASAPAPKKPRKSKDVSYAEDAYGDESEEEVTNITLTQKQELAEKITHADGPTLQKAIDIIAKSTGLDGSNEEIELDIESLPSRTVVQLYNLVCRGRTPKKAGPGRPRTSGAGNNIPRNKPGRKPGAKHLNEQEEAARIRRMEAQLQTFEQKGSAGMGGGMGPQGYDDSDSSEDEESEDE